MRPIEAGCSIGTARVSSGLIDRVTWNPKGAVVVLRWQLAMRVDAKHDFATGAHLPHWPIGWGALLHATFNG